MYSSNRVPSPSKAGSHASFEPTTPPELRFDAVGHAITIFVDIRACIHDERQLIGFTHHSARSALTALAHTLYPGDVERVARKRARLASNMIIGFTGSEHRLHRQRAWRTVYDKLRRSR
ncbi:hypothetical protein [Ensifer adhaerens]